MPRQSGPSKYEPLRTFLADRTEDKVTLTFAEIEQIIGRSLPSSAQQSGFWANSPKGSFNVRPWRRAGWRVAGTHLSGSSPAVTFARLPPGSAV